MGNSNASDNTQHIFEDRLPRFERTLQLVAHFSSLVTIPEINRTFNNLVANAVPAIPAVEGIFSVQCREPEPQHPYLLVHCSLGDVLHDGIDPNLSHELKVVLEPKPSMVSLFGPRVPDSGLPGRIYWREDVKLSPAFEAAVLLHEGVHLLMDGEQAMLDETREEFLFGEYCAFQ